MGEGSGMGWLVSPLHNELQIRDELFGTGAPRTRSDRRLSTHHRKRWAFSGNTDPVAEQICGLMQKIPQHWIERIG